MRSLTLFFVSSLLFFPVLAQTKKAPGKPRPTTAKASVTPAKKPAIAKTPEEKTSWEKASKTEDAAARIEALKKFNDAFPKSPRRSESLALIVTARNDLATVRLGAGEIAAAATLWKDAAAEAPKPVPEQLWSEVLSKLPGKLFFRGARGEAYDAADFLEEKAEGNAAQMLDIAAFYLTVEDGTSARRVAEKVIAADPNSSLAYQTLGLANRVDLKIEDSESAFVKALELDPDSLTARRSLADARRALGKPAEAIALYREILEREEGNLPARTGLVLALFDSGKKSEAEVELAKELAANSGNVILLAGAAYWYATHNDADKAIEYATKAIEADPRYIWSHIALARGYMIKKLPAEAEKTLFMAQRYGNFPTMNYEIAAARLAAGYFKDAADALRQGFVISDGVVKTATAGRSQREAKDLTELIAPERKASFFAPVSNDDPESPTRLAALLDMTQAIDAREADVASIGAAVDKFVAGTDKMVVHRQLFAASRLLEKKVALNKVLELTKAAARNVDNGVDTPAASTAVMASEIAEIRASAAERGEYVNVPELPKNVLLSILRGEIEAISGWAAFQMEDPNEAVVRLKRAVTVLPADSSWWRSTTWRLGTALAATGKDAEALENYIKVYRSTGAADAVRYSMIEAVYRRVNGNTDGLESKIGPNPVQPRIPVSEVAPSPSPTPAAATQEVVNSPAAPTSTQTAASCVLRSSENEPIVSTAGTDLSIMIDTEGDLRLDELHATSSHPEDVSIKRENIAGVTTKAIFLMRSVSGKPGSYTITFEMPCGKKELTVTVR